ncbi:MAG: sigma-54-dependent Fis family transcriptional regulator [bacterium]|nr:sigma-54-dependent Fis family transcriptional regulator [bacterium]
MKQMESITMEVGGRAGIDDLILNGKSHTIHHIRNLVKKYSPEKEPVLLCGETGSGKNHIADLIHRYSGRVGKFVIVDTPNINGHLFESKLFGHRKGAFTDAKFDKTGLVEEADNGTLFFDEITEVPGDVQAKLLRFIDTQRYRTLGQSIEKQVNVRILAATNRNLQQEVEESRFRKDLYYRLNVLEIEVPPLRERIEDIKILVRENLTLLRGMKIEKCFWKAMSHYHWPGNVRELLNVLKRAGILLDGPVTGSKIMPIIHMNGKKHPQTKNDNGNGFLTDIREKLETGDTFWKLVWKPFIDRDIDRNAVKHILGRFYSESSCCFKKMIKRINVAEEDYQKFMSLLYKYKIDPRK